MSRVQGGSSGEPDLALILDHLPGLVAYWDADGLNRVANGAYVDWFGMSPDEVQGRHISELLGPELYESSREHIEGALAGEQREFERVVIDAHGQRRHLHVIYVPHFEDGEPAGFFVQGSDITARVQAEEALQDSIRQVALLEERNRIAADLHDLVIQRLFAAGLDLAAVQRGAEDAAARIDSVAVAVDQAIRELRGAIHSLHQLTAPSQLPSRIEALLGESARMLGFRPTMTLTGSVESLPESAVQDLLAVLNEALSNVARHAGATRAEVTLACTEEAVVLQVSDNGRGMGATTRSSGLGNMRRRAEAWGGTFFVRDNLPRGTVVEWVVPVPRPGVGAA